MRNLLFALAVLLLSRPVLAGESDEVVGLDCCKWRQGYWGSVDVINWTPRVRGLDFAITEDGSAFTVGTGQVREVNYDRDTGVRAQFGYGMSDGWGVNFGYTHFEAEGANTVNRPGGTGQLFPTISHPGGPAEADIAIAEVSFDYDVFDILARRTIVNNRHAAFDLFGGFRWADIGQRVGVDLDGRDFTNGNVTSSSDIAAFGLRFGGSGRWRMANWISVFGEVSGGALRANFENHRVETDFAGAQLLVDVEDSYTQATFNFDTSMGVAWQHDRWLVAAGYEVNVWTNLSENLRFVDDIEQGGLSSMSGDLLLEGFFVRVAKSW